MRPHLLLAAAACALTGAAIAQTASQSAANIHAHMAFLASDSLHGREAGSADYDIAANYVASQMEQLGLKPLGDEKGGKRGYFQHVPLTAYRATDTGSLAVTGKSGATPLTFGQDYSIGGQALGAKIALDLPLVFVGFGVTAPEHGRDDYKGVDVKGKIAVMLSGGPKPYQTEERAYYANRNTKLENAYAHGAAAMLLVNSRTQERLYPFANFARQYQTWSMAWRDASGKPHLAAPIPQLGTISNAGAAKLFASAPMSAAQVLDAGETAAGATKSFALGSSLKVELHSEIKPMESENIVGVLPGADPKLKGEYVVLSAHLDHIGVTPPVNGDGINNGAMDNASGVATTLEVANLFKGAPAPRRSVIFLVDTAEEKGLVGADYYARNPTVPLAAIAGDVDLDMPILTYDFTDVTAFGADRSTLGPAVKRAAGRMNIALSPDPEPDEGIFTRSDHYRFVQQGVPAVFLATGFANGGEAATHDFMKNHYHKPSDDLSLPIRYDAGAKFAKLNYEITRELADMDARPAWNKGDFFGDKYRK